MITIATIFYCLVIPVVLIIITSLIKRWLRKYIEKRIDEGLTLLENLESINDELDTKIDSVKIKIYNMYLDRCRESLSKEKRDGQRDQGNGTEDKRQNIKKIKKVLWRDFLPCGSGESQKTSVYEFFLSSFPFRRRCYVNKRKSNNKSYRIG